VKVEKVLAAGVELTIVQIGKRFGWTGVGGGGKKKGRTNARVFSQETALSTTTRLIIRRYYKSWEQQPGKEL